MATTDQFFTYSISVNRTFKSKDDAVKAARRELERYKGTYDTAYILQATDVVSTPVPQFEVTALNPVTA